MARPRHGTLRALRVLWGFRRKLVEGVRHDVRHRYAGSLLGLGWSLAFPLAQMAIFAAVYVFIFRVRPSGLTEYQYLLMVFAGLLPLMAFNEALGAGAAALSGNRNLLTSTVFPSELIPLRALLAAQVPPLAGFALVAAFTLVTGAASPASLVLVPLVWLLLLLFCAGLSWMLSLVSLIARDVQHVLPLVLMALTILSPFAYTPEMVPASLKPLLYLNPLSYFVFCFQDLLAFGRLPQPFVLAMAAAMALAAFSAGFLFFRKARAQFFDYA
jgi:lipopolysaccharide transport system permease protein